jgi:glycyl-tRNA synthetase beta chain
MNDLLLEIGCENIPASYIPPAVAQLRRDSAARFDELRLAYGDIYTSGTPRRLVLLVKGLAAAQKSRIDVVTGPPVSKAFDEDGAPTRAAAGFARSHGLSVDELDRVQTPKGEYLGFKKREKGRRASALLKDALPELIAKLRWPKTMRWEGGGVKFTRPIRWIVCLYGDSVVRFSLAGVKSGNVSYFMPWIDPHGITIPGAASYMETMAKEGILLDQDERREHIARLAGRAAKQSGYVLIDDAGLLHELTFMLEKPHVFVGNFPETYLSLPQEVVVTAMKAHQRYFALRKKNGSLVPKFIAFMEGKLAGPAQIREGNEKVLRARLEDAYFYWREDLKRGIEGLARMLQSIVFIEQLGTLKDKASRLNKLMGFINETAGGSGSITPGKIERLSLLAKADLASEMVKDGKEFTLLEGLIGSHYAAAAGEDPDLVAAIKEQYRPRSPSDPLPGHPLGNLLGLADRMDTICGCFIVGLVPTGSGDPYGLRRLANGLIRLVEGNVKISIDKLIEHALDGYVEQGYADAGGAGETLERLRSFFITRCDSFLTDKGFSYDVVRAVTRVAWPRPAVAVERCEGIETLRGDEAFERLIISVKRVGNILNEEARVYGAEWDVIERSLLLSKPLEDQILFSADLFEEPQERELFDEVCGRIPDLAALDARGDFPGVLRKLSETGPAIDHYFDSVLVNCKDERIRTNRIRFLASIFALFSRFADFSYIVEEKSPTAL